MIVLLNENQVIIKGNNNNIVGYTNCQFCRAALAADCPPEIVAEVMAMWGDTPTVPDEQPRGEPLTPAQEIATLKQQIADTDYKIIKCSECRLVDKPMPYDVAALHRERQALRDEINRLEATTP